MRPLILVQARMGSTRLPGKVLEPLTDRTVLDWVIGRCRLARLASGVALATSDLPGDDLIARHCEASSIPVFRGNECDVLERYLGAASHFGAALLVRITCDCPLIAPEVIDAAIELQARTHAEYASIEGYPNGVGDAEVVSVAALSRAYGRTSPGETFYREHVTSYITRNPEEFSVATESVPPPLLRPELRLSVDEPADLEVVRHVAAHFSPRRDFSAVEIVAWADAHPEIRQLNRHVKQKTT